MWIEEKGKVARTGHEETWESVKFSLQKKHFETVSVVSLYILETFISRVVSAQTNDNCLCIATY